MKRYLSILVIVILAVFLNGCADTLKVTHDPLAQVENKKEGNILVKEFKDSRDPSFIEHIGRERNGWGMVIYTYDSRDRIEPLLTGYFAEALREAGYSVVVEGTQGKSIPPDFKADAIIEGEILVFWIDAFVQIWQDISISVKALEKDTNKILWEKKIVSEETSYIGRGKLSNFEKVINKALTNALNEAAKDFASDEFYRSIKTNKETQ